MANLRTAFNTIKANALAGNTTMLQGPPGIGKTDLMSKVARWWREQHSGKRVGYTCWFMATQTPIGITGLPWKSKLTVGDKTWTITDPAIPMWFMCIDMDTGEVLPASEFDTVFMVIEEWGQGSPETKRAGAELLRAKGSPPFYLPKGSLCVANSNVDPRDGVTKEYDFTINRVNILRVTPDVDVWDEDFASYPYEWEGKTWEVMPVSRAWAKQNPGIVTESKPEVQGPWCTFRSFTNLDRSVQASATLNGGVIPVNEPSFTEMCAGACGMPMAQSYVNTLRSHFELPHYEDIVADPDNVVIPTQVDKQLLLAYELAGRAKPQDMDALIAYMSRKPMPKDLLVTFMRNAIVHDYRGIFNLPATQQWISKNSAFLALLSQRT